MRTLIWNELDGAARTAALTRPAIAASDSITAAVRTILEEVRSGGDKAVLALTERFDKQQLTSLRVPPAERDAAAAQLSDAVKGAIQQAYRNVRTFHAAQLTKALKVETQEGVRCELVSRPLDAVGL